MSSAKKGSEPLLERDRTPPSIVAWVCPQCGYWRQEESTGVHMFYAGTGAPERHRLVQAQYIYEGLVR